MLIVGKLSHWPLCSHLVRSNFLSPLFSQLKSVKPTVHFQPYLLTAIQPDTKHSSITFFFHKWDFTFCFDKINYRSRLSLSSSLLAAFISRLPRVSMRVSALKNASALLLLPLGSPGFSRHPAGWQLPHRISWRLKGPHTLHVLHARVILLLGFFGGWDCLQPQVFSFWQFLPSRTSKQISSMSVKAVECY